MYAELRFFSLIFVVNLIYQCRAQMPTTEIREKLKEFNQQTKVETNIFIYNSKEVEISDYITGETTVILVNRMQTNFQLIYQINKNALAIVLVTETKFNDLLDILNELLTRLRHLKVLIILPPILSDEKLQLTIFKWAWQSGYTHIMSLYTTTNVNDTQIKLMSYTPFPELQLVTVERPEDYFRSTLPQDFQGHPIRTPLGQSPPIVFSYTDRYGHQKTSGMMYYIFRHFIQVHNATLEEVVLPEPYPESVAIQSVLAAVQRNQLDISLHFYFADYDKWHINQPPFSFPFYFRVPNAKPLPFKDFLWAPFERKLWRTILNYMLFTSLVLTIVKYISTRIEDVHSHNCYTRLRQMVLQNLHTFIDNFLQLLPSLSFTANRRCQRSSYKLRLNLIYILHCILAFILVNNYSALIVSFLTTGVYQPQINSITDVINSPFKIQLTYSDLLYFIADEELRRKVVIVSWSELWEQLKTLNDSVILMNTEWAHDFFGSQQTNLQYKRVRLLQSEIIWDAMCGMIMPLNSPYVEMLTDMLLWSFNTGLFAKAYYDSKWDAYNAGILQKLPRDSEAGFALNVQYFYWAWWLCVVGYILSTGVFILERFWHKRIK